MSSHHVTRNRTSYSCYTCRRRKVRCDKSHPRCSGCRKSGNHCVYDALQRTTQPKTLSVVGAENPSGGEIPLGVLGMDWSSKESVNDEELAPDANNPAQLQLFDNHESGASSNYLSAQDPFFDMEANGSVRGSPGSPMLPGSVNTDFDIPLFCTSDGSLDFELPSSNTDLHSGRHNNESTSEETFGVRSNTRTQIDSRSLTYPMMTRARLPKEPLRSTSTIQASVGNLYGSINEDLESNTRNHAYAQHNHLGIRDNTGRHSPTGSRSHDMHHGLFANSLTKHIIDDHILRILNRLPSKLQCDVLFSSYILRVHPVIPISTIPVLVTSYDLFWKSMREAEMSAPTKSRPLNTTLILSVIYGGSVACSEIIWKRHFPGKSRTELSNSLKASLETTLKVEGFPQKPQLHSLVAFVILQRLKADAAPVSMDSNTLALRVAYRLGLHRDPQQSNLNAQMCELRRRLWWYIVATEALVCVSFKIPLIAYDMSRSDVRELSEVQDQHLGMEIDQVRRQANILNDESLESPEHSPYISEIVLVAKSRAYLTQVQKIVLDMLHGVNPVELYDIDQIHKHLYKLQTRLKGYMSRIPVLVDTTIGSAKSDGNGELGQSSHEIMVQDWQTRLEQDYRIASTVDLSSINCRYSVAARAWARASISLMISKSYCVLYQHFLRETQRPCWLNVRHRALEHAHKFLEELLYISTESIFLPFQWSLPGDHQPLHAVTILLIDLCQFPDAIEAAHSRFLIRDFLALRHDRTVTQQERLRYVIDWLHGERHDGACDLLERMSHPEEPDSSGLQGQDWV